MILIPLVALNACFDYKLGHDIDVPSPGEPPIPAPSVIFNPNIVVSPAYTDFGAVDPWSTVEQLVNIRNVGTKDLVVSDLSYDSDSPQMAFTDPNEPLPWTLAEGESRDVIVDFTPIDDSHVTGTLAVQSDDPREPVATAVQEGFGLFQGFQAGWYIVNDDTAIDLTTDPAHRVDYNGDTDAYWYEPSGVHGMTGSTDVAGDFQYLHDYIVDRSGGPITVTGPLTFHEPSTLDAYHQGSFSYIMCDFWMDATDDPTQYTIKSGKVDDGIRVIVNGQILGELTYNQTGSWPLVNATPGQINTLIVILEDNAKVEKYIYDLGFYRNGVMVGG